MSQYESRYSSETCGTSGHSPLMLCDYFFFLASESTGHGAATAECAGVRVELSISDSRAPPSAAPDSPGLCGTRPQPTHPTGLVASLGKVCPAQLYNHFLWHVIPDKWIFLLENDTSCLRHYEIVLEKAFYYSGSAPAPTDCSEPSVNEQMAQLNCVAGSFRGSRCPRACG